MLSCLPNKYLHLKGGLFREGANRGEWLIEGGGGGGGANRESKENSQ